ncbi:YtpI family protein [Siminovitchia sp. 179-K 8D1 HS]|uniref:YtpI family protein n=1 Tax=Siminovitchia sp. 179-K 8D1 HS TaxID=3142385 RepID=UPI00399F7767
MPFLVFFIILSFSFYIYYKMKYIRSRRPMERKMLNGKSGMALGLFVALFGINQLFLFNTTVTYIVAAVFITIGGLSVWAGFRNFRHHVPYAREEARQLEREQN